MVKGKYRDEYHELIDILNEHQKATRQMLITVMSAFVFPLAIIVIVSTANTIKEIRKELSEIKQSIDNVEHRVEFNELHIKRLYLNDFNFNPYERGSTK